MVQQTLLSREETVALYIRLWTGGGRRHLGKGAVDLMLACEFRILYHEVEDFYDCFKELHAATVVR